MSDEMSLGGGPRGAPEDILKAEREKLGIKKPLWDSAADLGFVLRPYPLSGSGDAAPGDEKKEGSFREGGGEKKEEEEGLAAIRSAGLGKFWGFYLAEAKKFDNNPDRDVEGGLLCLLEEISLEYIDRSMDRNLPYSGYSCNFVDLLSNLKKWRDSFLPGYECHEGSWWKKGDCMETKAGIVLSYAAALLTKWIDKIDVNEW